jgi:ribosomal protein S18 acetylase RimI-like enzyme
MRSSIETVMEQLFREWEAGDLPSVRDVTWRTWVDAYSHFIPLEDLRSYFDDHYSADAVDRFFRNPDVRGYVALIDGHVVGSLRAYFNREEGRFYVSSLYILPECQGMGLGGRLMQMAEKRAQECGVRELWLGVMTQNTPAMDWYRKRGFEFVEELPFSMGHTTVQHLIGFKKLPTV